MTSINHTAEQRAQLNNASFSRRMGAAFYDGLLLLALWMISTLVVIALNDREAPSSRADIPTVPVFREPAVFRLLLDIQRSNTGDASLADPAYFRIGPTAQPKSRIVSIRCHDAFCWVFRPWIPLDAGTPPPRTPRPCNQHTRGRD